MKKILIILILGLILLNGCINDRRTLELRETEKKPYTCSYNKFNCDDFKDWEEAQLGYYICIDKKGYDVHHLDGDKDGIACEVLR